MIIIWENGTVHNPWTVPLSVWNWAGTAGTEAVPDKPGLEYRPTGTKLHYRPEGTRLHYRPKGDNG